MENLSFQNKEKYFLKKKGIILIIALFSLTAKSQNLVLNPSFEDTISCNDWMGGTLGNSLPAIYWYYSVQGSPDYFHPSYCNYSLMPSSQVGYQWARTGIAYEGFGAYSHYTYNHHEFIGGQLGDTMEAGHSYCISFYLSLADKSKHFIDRIGVYFTNDTIQTPTQGNYAPYYIPYTPQFESTQGNMIDDTMNWVLVTGNITAQGGERFFAIGNFRDDNFATIDSFSNALFDFAYYFIDDVSIIDCTVGIVENPWPEINITPNPVENFMQLQITNYKPTSLELKILDVLGKEIYSNTYTAGLKPKDVDVSRLVPGVYFLNLRSSAWSIVKKFIKQ